jgi:hypothetical protein
MKTQFIRINGVDKNEHESTASFQDNRKRVQAVVIIPPMKKLILPPRKVYAGVTAEEKRLDRGYQQILDAIWKNRGTCE